GETIGVFLNSKLCTEKHLLKLSKGCIRLVTCPQVKSLLGPQFLKQQPDSKLEKADVLEMRVCFLRRLQQQHQAVNTAAVDQGYSSCIREMMYFLSKDEVKKNSPREDSADYSPLSSTVQTSITKDKSPVNSVLWRSW
uniref:BHLH domain-containing protein n=1 Tax=Amphiprion ocellaris TaxID=80972 RepID=A0A3Q1B6B2_AMPOC